MLDLGGREGGREREGGSEIYMYVQNDSVREEKEIKNKKRVSRTKREEKSEIVK